jgi:hypothetical protein
LKPSEIQDLGDIMPKLLEIKNKANFPLAFRIQIEIGNGETQPDDETIRSINLVLKDINDKLQLGGITHLVSLLMVSEKLLTQQVNNFLT